MNLTSEQLLTSIWAALRRIEDNMALPPAPLEPPLINVAPPDLAGVVTAVTSLKPGPTADEIAVAIAGVLSPTAPQADSSAALDAVAAALEKLDFRLKGMGVQAYGGGAVSLQSGQTIGIASLPSTSRTDTFTTTASGAVINCTAVPLSAFSIQVKGTAATPTTWDVRLEGSLDGTNFSQILQHTNSTGDAAVLYSGAVLSPSLYIRSRCDTLTLGPATNVVATVLGTVA